MLRDPQRFAWPRMFRRTFPRIFLFFWQSISCGRPCKSLNTTNNKCKSRSSPYLIGAAEKKETMQGAAIHETSVNPNLTLKTGKQNKAVCLDKSKTTNICINSQDTKERNPPSPLQQLMLYANVPVLWICYGSISLNISHSRLTGSSRHFSKSSRTAGTSKKEHLEWWILFGVPWLFMGNTSLKLTNKTSKNLPKSNSPTNKTHRT